MPTVFTPSTNDITQPYSSKHRAVDFSGIKDTEVNFNEHCFAAADMECIERVDKYDSNWIANKASDPFKNDPRRPKLLTEDYGNYAKYRDSDGFIHLYCHLKKGSVSQVGKRYKAGEKMQEVIGNTGNSSGRHLHYELRNSGNNNIKPTFKEVSMPGDEDALKNCLADREKFWKERDEALKEVDLQKSLVEKTKSDKESVEKERDNLKRSRDRFQKERDELKTQNEKISGELANADKDCQIRVNEKNADIAALKKELSQNISDPNHLSKTDFAKMFKNLVLFSAPNLIVVLISIRNGLPVETAGTTIIVLNIVIDLIKKYLSRNSDVSDDVAQLLTLTEEEARALDS